MGYYINPKGGLVTNEMWLELHGVRIQGPVWPAEQDALVCLVDNGMFKVAGVCYRPEEMRAFDEPRDERPKKWYWVPKTKLPEVGIDLKIFDGPWVARG